MKGKDKRKHRKRREQKRNSEKTVEDSIDMLIDCDFEDFKRNVLSNKIPIGELNGLRIIFSNCYSTMFRVKEDLMLRIKEHPEEEEECKYNIQRCYIVMEKLEEKIVWLKDREKEVLSEVNVN